MNKASAKALTRREIKVEFVESEETVSFDFLAKAIAGAIRKELKINDKPETR